MVLVPLSTNFLESVERAIRDDGVYGALDGKSVPLSTGPSKSQVCYSVIGYRLHGAAFGPAKLLCSFRFIISL